VQQCFVLKRLYFTFYCNIFTLFFFSASTSRSSSLQSKLNSGVSVKRPSETRWSGRHDACYSLNVNWTEIISALQVIQNDESQKPTVKCEATGILRSLQCLETAGMTSFWSAILKRFNSTNKSLQSENIDIGTVIELYSSLLEYVRENRSMSMYDTYEKAGFEKSKIGTYKTVTKRRRSRKLQLEERDFNTTFEGKGNLWVNTYLVIIDILLSEIEKRKKSLEEFHGKFEFMNNILERDNMQLLNGARTLQEYYKQDLEEFLCDEIIHFKVYIKSNEIKIPSLGDMYRVLL